MLLIHLKRKKLFFNFFIQMGASQVSNLQSETYKAKHFAKMSWLGLHSRKKLPEQLRELGELQIPVRLGVHNLLAVADVAPVAAAAVDQVDILVELGSEEVVGLVPLNVVRGRAGERQATILKKILEPGLELTVTIAVNVYPRVCPPTTKDAVMAPTMNAISAETGRLAHRQNELFGTVLKKEDLELELRVLLHELTHNLILKHRGHGKDARDLLTDIRVRHHGRGRGLVLGHGHVFVVPRESTALY